MTRSIDDRRRFLKSALAGVAGGALIGTGVASSIWTMGDPYGISKFTEKIGSLVRVTSPSGKVSALRLAEVINHAHGSVTGECFSIEFEGLGETVIPQDIYRIEVDALTDVDLLLVPVWSDSGTPRYETVINRRMPSA